MNRSVFKIAAVVVVLGAGVWIAAEVQNRLSSSAALTAGQNSATEPTTVDSTVGELVLQQAPDDISDSSPPFQSDEQPDFGQIAGEELTEPGDTFDSAAALATTDLQDPSAIPVPAAEPAGFSFDLLDEETPAGTAVRPAGFDTENAVRANVSEPASDENTGVFSFADLQEDPPQPVTESNPAEPLNSPGIPDLAEPFRAEEQPDFAEPFDTVIEDPSASSDNAAMSELDQDAFPTRPQDAAAASPAASEDPLFQFDTAPAPTTPADDDPFDAELSDPAMVPRPDTAILPPAIEVPELEQNLPQSGFAPAGEADFGGPENTIPSTRSAGQRNAELPRRTEPVAGFDSGDFLPTSPSPTRPTRPAAEAADPEFFVPGDQTADEPATFGSDEGAVPFPVDAGAVGNGGQLLPPLETEPTETLPSRGAVREVTEEMRPQLSVRKEAPASAIVGVPLIYSVFVSNNGDASAFDVVIEDELTSAAELIRAIPAADHTSETGVMSWSIPELRSGETKEIRVQVRPIGEGTLNGTATVRFHAQVRSSTIVRAPRLILEILGPPEVRVGDQVALQFRIHNRGTGDATGVMLHSILPPALRHPEGSDLEYELAVLPAGESELVDLQVVAAESGDKVRIAAELTSQGGTSLMARADLTVVGAQLAIQRLGPDRRYVGRSASFQNVVSNDTNFPAEDAEVIETVPHGMRIVSIGQNGQFNETTRQIRWKLPVIQPGRQTVLDVELVPDTAGQMESSIEVVESAGFRSLAADNTVVMVEGLHNVTANISRVNKPVAIGERFGFTVTVNNRGTATAKNVRVALQVPQGIRVMAAGTREVPGELLSGNIVRYVTVPIVRPNEKFDFQITLQGQESLRNAVVRAQLRYDEMETPLVISESVTVFDDAL